MPPAYEVLLLNTAIPQIQAAQSGDTYVVPRDIAINATAIISANSATDALRITQTGAGNALVVEDSANPDSTPFVVTATGAVGVGDSAPATKMVVAGTDPGILGLSYIYSTDSATQNKGGQLTFGGSFTGTTSTYFAAIAGRKESVTSGNYDGYLQFLTRNAVSDMREVMRLDSSGNLGLGVTPKTDWSADYDAFQLGGGSSLSGHTSTSLNFTVLASNQYVNTAGTSKFINDGYAPRYLQRGDNGEHYWYTTNNGLANGNVVNTQAMTLDASGNLGIGTTSPVGRLDVVGNYARFSENASGAEIYLRGYYASVAAAIQVVNNFPLLFLTNNTERARITSGGYFKASNSGTYANSAGLYHEFYNSLDGTALYVSSPNANQSSDSLLVVVDRNTTNNSFYAINYYNNGAGAYKFRVADSGDVTNTNGTYGTISDAKMKTDIVDAGSQWSDIKALRFRKFKMKDDPSGLVQLGVVAQEVEQTSPGLVDEHADKDAEGNDLGTTTKSVKTSILLMKAAVALQEAMARIEQLEAKVASLGA